MRRTSTAFLLALALAAGAVAFAPTPPATDGDLTGYVDPLIGSTPPGFTNPGPVLPHGMASPGPDTEGPLVYGGYYLHNRVITGFSQTHMSAGVPQAGVFPMLPVTGEVRTEDPAAAGYPQPVPAYAQPYDQTTQVAEPGYYAATLLRGAIRAELTATERVAYHRYTFPSEVEARVVVDAARSLKGYRPATITRLDEQTLAMTVDQDSPDHTVFGVLRFTSAPTGVATLGGAALAVDDTVTDTGVVVDFPAGSTVEGRVGLSFTDLDGALRNLEAETAGVTFDDAHAAADAAWEEALGQVEVVSALDAAGATPPLPRADADKVRLYTALYHHRLFPSLHSDVDGRYRGPDDGIRTDSDRPHYSQFSLWDSYRGQNALLAVLDPARYEDMLHSLADFADQHGTLPRWQLGPRNPGYMSGDPAVPFVAAGICRDVGDRALHERLLADIGDSRAARQAVLGELGYLPVDQPSDPVQLVEGGSRDTGTTLEYGVADAAAALVAGRLGRHTQAEQLAADALRYRNVQDPDTGWIRPRDADGEFAEGGWSPESGYGFQEGTSWQYSWLAMHDWTGLVEGMGGDDVVQQRLDTFFNLPATAGNGFAWGNVQNKQTAFGLFYFGNQFAPGNEHDLEAPYAYNAAGAPWKTQAAVRAATSVYSATPDGLPGNDDLGALSGWLVWSLLGVHPTIPGAPVYLVGSPTFPHATIHTPSGDLVIEAPGADEAAKYVTSPALADQSLDRTWFTEEEWREAGSFAATMSAVPDTAWGTGPAARPPSVADDLAVFGC